MSARYASFVTFAPHGAVHCLIGYSRHGRKKRRFSSPSWMSRWHVRNLKTFCSSDTDSRRAYTLVNGPNVFVPRNASSVRLRVMNTPGKSSRSVITRYGKVLSSVRRALKRGWMSLISRFSVSSASHSPSQAITSKSTIKSSIGCFLGPRSADGTK